jgi:predicted alpha/beta-hydrolase family hydrolase
MASLRRTGQKKPPDREPMLRASWHQVIDFLGPDRLVIGGKSMGESPGQRGGVRPVASGGVSGQGAGP